MKTTTGRGKSMSVLSCDLDGCNVRFHTASVTGLTRKQAKTFGWGRASRGRAQKHLGLTDEQVAENLGGGRMVDLCPDHMPPPPMRRGPS